MKPQLRRASPLAALLFLMAALVVVKLSSCAVETSAPTKEGEFLFCFWNLENFFDDRDDGHKTEPDRTFDEWFANDPTALQEKLDHLSTALLALNGGNGPDILAVAEAESERAVELLRDRLNKGIKDEALHYKHILIKDPKGGRSIMTALLTRTDVIAGETHLLGRRQRILEGHLKAGGQELVVIASHWTSRVSDKEGEGRDKYADIIYGRYKGMYRANPKVAFLVCGDFNDPPDEDSVVKHLHAIGDRKKVLESDRSDPLLFNLFADRTSGKEGSHYYDGKWLQFDQICVSPAMLEGGGWTCDPTTAHTVTEHTTWTKGRTEGRPKPFGNKRYKGERGTSDHLPVTAKLRAGVST
jgi:endonuclease/exonuclease/phosphatase family metal-dependent hydrolase